MLKTAKVVGLNSDNAAALALVSPSQTSNLTLFLIAYCEAEDAFSKVRQSLSEAEEAFYSADLPVADRLNEAANMVKSALSEAVCVQVMAAAVLEDSSTTTLYFLSQSEQLLAFLLRDKKVVSLSAVGEVGQLISGILEEGNRVILTTESLINLLGGSVDRLAEIPFEGLEDEITSQLPHDRVDPVAVIILEKEKVVKEEETIKALGQSLPKGNVRQYFLGNLKFVLSRLLFRSKRETLVLGVVILGIVLVGLVVNFQRQKNSQILAQFEKNLQETSEHFSKAGTMKDTDSALAYQELEAAKGSLAKALKIKPQDNRALALKKQLEEDSGEILRVHQVTDFPLWLDLGLIKKDLTAKSFSLSLGKLLLLDTDKKTLILLDLNTKANQILAGQEKLGEAKLASLNGNLAWVYSLDKGLVKTDTQAGETKAVVKKDDDWGEIVDIYGFANRIYLLDRSKNQVWKYVPVVAGYSEKQTYFKEGVKADLGSVKKLQIDSSVWILKGGGEITKFTQGTPDYFSLSGLDKPVKEVKSFFVSDETDNLYLLDSGNKRLLVLDKKGVYKTQYQSDQFANFSDLVVDEKRKKVYLLAGSKIFQLELK